MYKITVLYGHPTDASVFDNYYNSKHITLVKEVEQITRVEITKFISGPGGGKSEYYLMAELYFDSEELMQKAMGSPDGQAMADDLSNFATGGVTIMIGTTV